jgi:hypothetical protein
MVTRRIGFYQRARPWRQGFSTPEGSPEGTLASVAPNITSDPAVGIGAWSDQEIGRAITRGIGRDERKLKPPMAYGFYAGLKETDLADIIAYLRNVPPLE